MTTLLEENFSTLIDGLSTALYHLSGPSGLNVWLTNYGARIVALEYPNISGKPTDVVLGFNHIDHYLNAVEQYHGATIGRYANRIANAAFQLEGKTHRLVKNNATNCLHGGAEAWHKKVWNAEKISTSKIIFRLSSPDNDEGFPGEVLAGVTYEITENDTLEISFEATSSKPSPINMTHHSYFNLNGEGHPNAMDHLLTLNCNAYTPISQFMIPTGEMTAVEGSPFDFITPKQLQNDISTADPQLSIANGFDHNFVVKDWDGSLKPIAEIRSEESGICMRVEATQPGIQLYTANWLDGSDIGKSGRPYFTRSAICLETQHYPDSPNQKHFPSTIIEPGSKYFEKVHYKFSNFVP